MLKTFFFLFILANSYFFWLVHILEALFRHLNPDVEKVIIQ